MSASTAAALKVVVEEAGLGLAAYRDQAPRGTPRPYVTISDGISTTFERHGDEGDPNADLAVSELAQVDLWERSKAGNDDDYDGSTDDPFEAPALHRNLLKALKNNKPDTSPTHVYGVTVDDHRRIVEDGTGVIHHAYTVRLRRRA